MFTENMSQQLGLAAAPRHAATINNTTGDTGGVDMRLFERVIFFFSVGTNGSSASLVFKLQESTDDVTYTDITGGATAAITAANKCGSLEVRSDQLTKRYVRCRCTESATQTATVATIALGCEARHKPGGKGATETATVAERLVV